MSLHYVTVPVLVKVVAAHNRTFVTSGVEVGILTGATLKEGVPSPRSRSASSDSTWP